MRTSLNLKKITAAVLSLIVCLTLLIGCSKEVPVEPGPKDVIYKFSEFTPKGESYSYLSGVAFYDNTIFVLVSKTEAAENTVLENSYLLKTDLSGEVMEKILLYSEAEGQVEFSFYSDISIAEDGTIYLVRVTVKNSDSEESVTKTEIVSIEGETQTVLADVSERLLETDADAISIYFSDFTENEKKSIPDDIDLNIADGDDRYEYYSYSNSSIYGYNDDVRMLVADLSASGVPLSDITRVIPVSDTQFLITGYTQNTIGFNKLYMLTKVAPEDVPDKSIITVAAIAEPIYFDDYIKEFSLTHPYFQVEYKQYAVDSNTTYDQALTAFNNDIIAGNIPDVIVIEPEMPYGNYVSKGMLADLYPFIDEDPDYSREDFLEPLLKAFETDGKLYSITSAFYVETLVGKTSIFGENGRQSFEELQASAANITGTESPYATLFGKGIDRDVFTERILIRMARGFIDDVNGVCSFETPEFISLLEFSKSLPAPAPDAEPYQFRFIPGETNDYKTDKALIELWNFSDFRHIVSLEKTEFGEPVTFLGFPNEMGGSGVIARPILETAIMAKAQNPDGAWEFVKGHFSYGNFWIESMGYPPMGTFPTLMSELNITAENATIPPYETWYGERKPRVNWLIADLSNQPDNTEADNAKMFKLFDSIDGIHRTIPAIQNIIKEETAAYYAGGKTAEDTAAIIQNRATTYLEETK